MMQTIRINFLGVIKALVVLVILLASFSVHADSWREKVCKESANIYLRVQANVNNADQTVTYSCLCAIPQLAYQQYMSQCMSMFSDQDLSIIQNTMGSSACSNYRSLAYCVRSMQ